MLLITAAAARENGTRKIAELPKASHCPRPLWPNPSLLGSSSAEGYLPSAFDAAVQADRMVWPPSAVSGHDCCWFPDSELWGVPDRWDLPTTGYGDCEDMQLLKRKLLAERGLPRRAMRMTVVINVILPL